MQSGKLEVLEPIWTQWGKESISASAAKRTKSRYTDEDFPIFHSWDLHTQKKKQQKTRIIQVKK
jgi:hypothetical protein